jgi:membrane dipeptidase
MPEGRFNFGLSLSQEERAARLHRDSIIVDLASQGAGGNILDCYPKGLRAEFDAKLAALGTGIAGYREASSWPYEMSRQGRSDLIRDWLLGCGLTCGAYSVPVHDPLDARWAGYDPARAAFADLPWRRAIVTAAQIRQAKQDGVLALYGFWQPTAPVPRDLQAIDAAYAKGLRSLMLTYNRMDHIGVGCTERVDAGLSMYGVEVVEHCNELGIIVDVSHCGHSTTMDACRFSRKPVNANHTAARSVYAHVRGKSDEALRAIAATGGVIGVVAVPAFLSAEGAPSIEHMLDHIDYIAALVGCQHVAIGTDWPLQAPIEVLRATAGAEAARLGFRDEDRIDVTQRLIGFEDCRDLPNITRGLVKRGYSDEQIQGILGENALRVFAEVCG